MVTSTSESSTRPPTTSRRLMAAVVRVEDLPSAGRRTLTPSTAVRAVRFRGTGQWYRRVATPHASSPGDWPRRGLSPRDAYARAPLHGVIPLSGDRPLSAV